MGMPVLSSLPCALAVSTGERIAGTQAPLSSLLHDETYDCAGALMHALAQIHYGVLIVTYPVTLEVAQ